jgi:hypothetical protein
MARNMRPSVGSANGAPLRGGALLRGKEAIRWMRARFAASELRHNRLRLDQIFRAVRRFHCSVEGFGRYTDHP